MEILRAMRGEFGLIAVDNTVTVTVEDKIASIYVNEPTVFTAIEDIDGNDILAESNLAGFTVNQGALIGSKHNAYIKTVTLASGSVLLLR